MNSMVKWKLASDAPIPFCAAPTLNSALLLLLRLLSADITRALTRAPLLSLASLAESVGRFIGFRRRCN